MSLSPRLRRTIRYWVALNFVAVGVLHFTHGALFAAIVPPFLPAPMALVYISGVAEIAGGVGLLVPKLRRAAGWGLLALLVAVYPANIHMAVNEVYLPVDWIPQNPLGLWLRLPFQFVFAAGVWVSMREGAASSVTSAA